MHTSPERTVQPAAALFERHLPDRQMPEPTVPILLVVVAGLAVLAAGEGLARGGTEADGGQAGPHPQPEHAAATAAGSSPLVSPDKRARRRQLARPSDGRQGK
ncbi:MAG: hypothetical protein M3464_02665 [Chloroflexota bacterium]|nr:hypothetical protein [Chloroflexota bacterium]